jgi:hypothetical protein
MRLFLIAFSRAEEEEEEEDQVSWKAGWLAGERWEWSIDLGIDLRSSDNHSIWKSGNFLPPPKKKKKKKIENVEYSIREEKRKKTIVACYTLSTNAEPYISLYNRHSSTSLRGNIKQYGRLTDWWSAQNPAGNDHYSDHLQILESRHFILNFL